ncbi:MAG TPA: hypothetical protein EYG39_04190, partial [Rhodothermales bacterium]|nr:hypothetical protein [Rhodothermales bacterium]
MRHVSFAFILCAFALQSCDTVGTDNSVPETAGPLTATVAEGHLTFEDLDGFRAFTTAARDLDDQARLEWERSA